VIGPGGRSEPEPDDADAVDRIFHSLHELVERHSASVFPKLARAVSG
jgi:hypothetical protein